MRFLLAQFLLPMLVMSLVMMPMTFDSAAPMVDLAPAGLWKGELWFIEGTAKVNWRDPENSTSLSALQHVSLEDLESAGPAVPLDASKTGSTGSPLPVGDRLWVLEADRISYYQNGVLTRLSGAEPWTVGDGRVPGKEAPHEPDRSRGDAQHLQGSHRADTEGRGVCHVRGRAAAGAHHYLGSPPTSPYCSWDPE